MEEQVSGDSRSPRRIQDAAARALQADIDQQMRGESTVVARIQDAAARASEQENAEPRSTDVDGQAPSNPAAQDPSMKIAEVCEKQTQPRLPAGAQQAPAESGEIGATTTATKNDREVLEELMKQAQEAWMTGKLHWGSPKQK